MRDKLMAYWIMEREAMRVRKECNAPKPWSTDKAMANVRYCNVMREDDKVTRWIAENWRNPHAKHPNLVYAMVMARLINWPETLQDIGFFEDDNLYDYADHAKLVMKLRMSVGKKSWSSAYIVSTNGRRMDKVDYIFDHVLAQVAAHTWEFVRGDTLRAAHAGLMKIDGLGSFLAGQVVADLKNTPGHHLTKAPDWYTWSCPGPGSLRGLNWFFHDTPDGPITSRTWSKYLDDAWQATRVHLPEGHKVFNLHMQDFQNCLCEFSKYCRVTEGDGRARNKYPG